MLVTRGLSQPMDGGLVTGGMGQGFESVIKRVLGGDDYPGYDPAYGDHILAALEKKKRFERERRERLSREIRELYQNIHGRAPTRADIPRPQADKAEKGFTSPEKAKTPVRARKRPTKHLDVFEPNVDLAADLDRIDQLKADRLAISAMLARINEKNAELIQMDEEEAISIILMALED